MRSPMVWTIGVIGAATALVGLVAVQGKADAVLPGREWENGAFVLSSTHATALWSCEEREAAGFDEADLKEIDEMEKAAGVVAYLNFLGRMGWEVSGATRSDAGTTFYVKRLRRTKP
jgi:hypothetical protein